MTETDQKKDRPSQATVDACACHSASTDKHKPRSCAQGAGREKAHSETDKSRDVGKQESPALLRHEAIYRKPFWM